MVHCICLSHAALGRSLAIHNGLWPHIRMHTGVGFRHDSYRWCASVPNYKNSHIRDNVASSVDDLPACPAYAAQSELHGEVYMT